MVHCIIDALAEDREKLVITTSLRSNYFQVFEAYEELEKYRLLSSLAQLQNLV